MQFFNLDNIHLKLRSNIKLNFINSYYSRQFKGFTGRNCYKNQLFLKTGVLHCLNDNVGVSSLKVWEPLLYSSVPKVGPTKR